MCSAAAETRKHKALRTEGNRCWCLITSSSSCSDSSVRKWTKGKARSGLMLTFSCFLCACTCYEFVRGGIKEQRQVCQAEAKLQREESDQARVMRPCLQTHLWLGGGSHSSAVHTKGNKHVGVITLDSSVKWWWANLRKSASITGTTSWFDTDDNNTTVSS